MTIVRGIDSDNYDGEVPQPHFQWLHDTHDIRFNIIGLEARMPYAEQQKANCEAVGIVVPFAYKFLYWRDDDLERMKDACRFGKPIAIDCEAAVPGWNANQVVGHIQTAKDLLLSEGLYWGIYTGAWWWPGNTGNSKQFADDHLWHAAYPFNKPNQAAVLPPEDYLPTSPFKVNYGGWAEADVHQYADVCYGDEAGPWAFDMNAMDDSLLPIQIPGNELAGIGIHYTDGSDEEIWAANGKSPDGLGLRFGDGRIATVWRKA